MAIEGWTGTLLPLLSLEAAVLKGWRQVGMDYQPNVLKALKKLKEQTFLLPKLTTAPFSFT